jgi:hypothetical protein
MRTTVQDRVNTSICELIRVGQHHGRGTLLKVARSVTVLPAGGREGRHEVPDVVFMVVEMNREPQVAIPRRTNTIAPASRARPLIAAMSDGDRSPTARR